MTFRDRVAPPRGPSEGALNFGDAKLRDIFLAMAEGLIFQTHDGQFIDANPAAERILGLSRQQILGTASIDMNWHSIREDGTPFPYHEYPAMVALRTGQAVHNEIMGVRTPDGELRWISINSRPIFVAEGAKPDAVVLTFVDITQQRQLTEALRIAREDLQAILDNVPARITSWHTDSTNHFVNKVAAAQYGICAAEAVGKHCRELVDAVRYARAKPYFEAALAGERLSHDQVDIQHDGSLRYSQVTYIPKVRNGSVDGLYVLGTDVTELRESYQRIRELAQRLETVREQERRYSAQMFHEGIAQDLYALKLGLDHLRIQATGSPKIGQACQELTETINQCMGAARQVANGFWPSALSHLRVSAVIEDYARYFGEISGLAIRVAEIEPFPALNEATGLILFRSAQEALTNVARHAQASRVDIVLRLGDTIAMDITDNGIGIEHTALAKPGSLGLLSIRERVGVLGGSLVVSKNVDGGTTVSVHLPLPSDA